MHINTLTAKPLLDLMFAQAGMEGETITPDRAWPVFAEYLRVPSQSGGVEASFHAVHPDGEEGRHGVVFLLIREVADEAPGYPSIRHVTLQYGFESLDAKQVEQVDIRTADFGSLDEFLEEVEGTAQFHFMQTNRPILTALFVEEQPLDE